MGLSIEVRKFINSKLTGEFVDVTLPGELPAKRTEIRDVQRDNAAIEASKRRVKELSAAKLTADKAHRAAQETLRKTNAEHERCAGELKDCEKHEESLRPNFEDAKTAFEAAKRDCGEKRRRMDIASKEMNEANSARRRAEQILHAATAASEAPDERQKQSLEEQYKQASDTFELKRTVFDAAKAVYDAADDEFRTVKSRYDIANSEINAAHSATKAAQNAKNILCDKVTKMTAREIAAKERLDKLTAELEAEEIRTVELQGSARSIAPRYESARFHYMESGKGEPLILIHSAGQSLYTFNKVFAKLAHRYRVIALDLAGHGYSDSPSFFDYEPEEHAEAIVRFMDAMGIETAHLLGYGMGACFALLLAQLHPERVDRIIAITPGGLTSEMPTSIKLLRSGIFGIFRRSTFSRKNIAKLIDDSLFDHTVLKEHDIDQYAEPFTNPDVRSGVQRTVMAFDEEDILDKLRSVDSEVLLLWGDKDNWRPIDMKDTYLAVLRHANLMIVRNSGHIPQEERPDRVCEMVFDFIPAGYDVEG